ncbi:MAG: sulfotransferase [Desulfuromonadaceae bacterium GWC2_58_13]|nr:MAG: sulfotransferase [Desulfuromonadaceae bacterium GWC2_58_13]
MAKFVWLASYPKSGNTWIRILLTNYLRDGAEPADINTLLGGPIASARSWFDEWVGIEASALTDEVVQRLRPDVYRCMAREEQETILMKVHDAWGLTDRNDGLFPSDITAGVVYILRNPLDMACSCAHHWGVSVEQAVQNLCDGNFALARSVEGMSDQLYQFLGSWSHHVLSWLDDSRLAVHVVKYEDLRADPYFKFGEVVKFCRFQWDGNRVRKAISFSEFSRLQRQEREKGFRERAVKASGEFFRRGQAGGWRDELPAHLVRRLIDVHGETMRRFGYLDENGNPL